MNPGQTPHQHILSYQHTLIPTQPPILTLSLLPTHSTIVDVHFPPGTHLALTVNGITREYSPIVGYLHVETSTGIPKPNIEVMIRMVPNGALSSHLRQVLSLETCGTSTNPQLGVTMPCHVPCNIYGPLYPAPAQFGYLPYYLPSPRSTTAATTSLKDMTATSNPVPVLVMIAGKRITRTHTLFINVPYLSCKLLPGAAPPLCYPR